MNVSLGTDIRIENGDFVTNPTGDLQLVSDRDCLVQDLKHMLRSPADALFLHPGWGAGLEQFLQKADTPLNRLDLQQAVQEGLESDPRMQAGSAAATVINWDRDSIQVQATSTPIGDPNPLSLILDLAGGDINVEVI